MAQPVPCLKNHLFFDALAPLAAKKVRGGAIVVTWHSELRARSGLLAPTI